MIQSFDLKFEDDHQLYRAYMPYVENGGIFISTQLNFELGDKVMLTITLPDSVSFEPFETVVVWVTPEGVGQGSPAGIGVRLLGDDAIKIQNDIEHFLVKYIKSKDPTDTI